METACTCTPPARSLDPADRLACLWEYYKAAAAVRGRKTVEADAPPAQSAFSLLWFFQRSPERLNPLARAFLGDSAAMDALDWTAPPPGGWEPFVLEGPALNKSQIQAIQMALSAPLSFLQGPPGTGKTETILNLACCAARLGGGHSVAIVSSNNSALDNIRTKILQCKDGQPNRLWLYEHFAQLGDKRKRAAFRDLRPEEAPAFQFHSCRVDVPTGQGVLTVNREQHIPAEAFLQKYPIFTSTIHSLQNCFQNGPSYCYDYVIMDEASQTDAIAGLVAMSCAKHLVLVGDPKQLPPVIGDSFVEEMEQQAAGQGWTIPDAHIVTADRSFLDVCLAVFGARTAKTVLRYHYRCHPGIIGFCAQTVYQEEHLSIETPDWDRSIRTPIRVRWFEGDYCEPCSLPEQAQTRRRSKCNRKQILCFMEEEWPQLYNRLWPQAADSAQEPPPSVCILSPFRGQLAALREAIQQDLDLRGQDGKGIALEESPVGGGADPSQALPMLTIHKSQGQEFDIIYLLPVEDGDWEWPWSQQKRLINVAVSRAKRELCLVLSSVLMEEGIQRELTGRPVPPEKGPATHGNADDQRFLQKLVRYVREENQALERETGTVGYPASTYRYGFHRSARTSVFDQEPWFRAEAKRLKPEDALPEKKSWSPERCLKAALVQVIRTVWEQRGIPLSLYQNVRLKDVRDSHGRSLLLPEDEPQLQRLVDYGSHLDFVLCQGSRILVVIEVDGGYHRTSQRQQERDQLKNHLLQDILGAEYYYGNAFSEDRTEPGVFSFIRLPDDGSTCLETAQLWDAGSPEQKARHFPLERLLEAQLNRPEDAPFYCIPTKSISQVVKGWDCAAEGSGHAAQRAGQQLLAAGQLVKQPCHLLGQPEKQAVSPTPEGQALGIISSVQVNQRGELYCNALYPKSAQHAVLQLLNGYPPLMAGMPVRGLLEDVYAFLHPYLQALGGQAEQIAGLTRLHSAISFQADRMDYQEDAAQALYILRYLYGYAYEYKQMYLRMLDREARPGAPLSVTSIGCGNMVDYWALRAALEERPGAVGCVHYTGVDLNRWSKRFQIRAEDGDTVTFLQKDAAVYLREQAAAGQAAADVYVFPKSISEFDGRNNVNGPVLRGIRDGLRAILEASSKERVWLLVSLPKSDAYTQKDQAKCACLREGLVQAGFHTGDDGERFLSDGERRKIREADRRFSYPPAFLRDMQQYGEFEGRHDPVMYTNYMCYQALLFQREE